MGIITSRRNVLGGIGASVIAAPAIIRVGSLMPINAGLLAGEAVWIAVADDGGNIVARIPVW